MVSLEISHTLYFKFHDKKKDFWQSQKLIQNHKQEGCGEGGDGMDICECRVASTTKKFSFGWG